jgi:hypothetical protein
VRENLIEPKAVKFARALGWFVLKISSPNRKGPHDRIFIKNGVVFTIEFKATGKSASPGQLHFAKELAEAGTPSRCFDNVIESKRFILKMEAIANDHRDKILPLVSTKTFEP